MIVGGQPVDGWSVLTGAQASAHDNGDPYPEWKVIHNSGAELVFDGQTHELIQSDKLRGTYNYINAVPIQEVNSMGDGVGFVVKGIGHLAVDYLPYVLRGNARGPD